MAQPKTQKTLEELDISWLKNRRLKAANQEGQKVIKRSGLTMTRLGALHVRKY